MTTPPSGNEPSLGGQHSDDVQLGGESAVLHAIEALSDSNPYVRERAAFFLAEQGHNRAYKALVTLMRRNLDLRGRSIRALGTLGDPRAIPLLIQQIEGRVSMLSLR